VIAETNHPIVNESQLWEIVHLTFSMKMKKLVVHFHIVFIGRADKNMPALLIRVTVPE
jgi:hypothetical protein